MTHLLDTNTCIVHLRSGGTSVVSRRLASAQGQVALCSIVVAELLFGAYRSRDVTANLAEVNGFCAGFPIFPFDEVVALVHARVRADLAAVGMPVGPYDSIIAATALCHDLAVVTHNTREFSQVPGLRLEDWQLSAP